MQAITQRYDGSKLWNLNIKLSEHYNDPVYAPISALRQEFLPVDYTNTVQIDSARLMLVFANIRAKDFKYYFYMLSLLERNDKPVKVVINDMRVILKDRLREQTSQGVNRLVAVGLLLRVESKQSLFFINPVYAWRGNRFDYLDLSELEVIAE